MGAQKRRKVSLTESCGGNGDLAPGARAVTSTAIAEEVKRLVLSVVQMRNVNGASICRAELVEVLEGGAGWILPCPGSVNEL